MKGDKSISKLKDIVEKIKELGLSYAAGAKHFDIPVWKIYDYNKYLKSHTPASPDINIETDQESDKKEKGDVSFQSPNVLPSEIVNLIKDYRQSHPDHGYKRIAEHLKKDHFVLVSRKKIREVLKSFNLHTSCDSSFDIEKSSEKGIRRFESPCPGDLYQIDVTYVYISGISVLYLIDIVDDYSRFCIDAHLSRDQSSMTIVEVLDRAIHRYGKPCRVLTDQGPSFYTWSSEQTRFQRYLDDMRIEHIVSDAHSPQTLGKVERFHQTIKKELLTKRHFGNYEEACYGISEYVHYYNYSRVHQGIGGSIPAERFHGIAGEISKLESRLCSQSLDLSRGYLVFKSGSHTVSVGMSSDGIQIFLDGTLLQGKCT
jgi:transposase InsO family protein